MRPRGRRSRVLRVSLFAASLLLRHASGSGQDVGQFPTPWYGAPTGIVEGPDGAMWFTDWQVIGRIDGSGAFSSFGIGTGCWPGGIAVGPDGNLWFACLRSNGSEAVPLIGRMTLAGALTDFPLPAAANRIVSGPDGNLWFTEADANRIGRITTSGTVTEFSLPTASAGLEDIAAGLDGNVWFTEHRGGNIGRITPDGTVTEFKLPSPNRNPGSIAAGPDGNLWFTEGVFRTVGRITPAGEITEFPMPAASHRIVAGKDGHLWILGVDRRVRRVSTGGAVTELASVIPAPLPNDLGIATDGSLWMTSGDGWDYGGAIYQFALDTSACVADARTLCLNGGRFRVTTEWKAPNGAHGSGHASALTADSGYFWFFDPASVELVVKVLNGCSGSRHYWVFGAGLTNVEVTTKVTDSGTGVTKQYTNPQGTPFAPIQDTAAFAACE